MKAAYPRDRENAALSLVGCVFSLLALRYPLRKPLEGPGLTSAPFAVYSVLVEA